MTILKHEAMQDNPRGQEEKPRYNTTNLRQPMEVVKPVGMLPNNFLTLSVREQFEARRCLFDRLLKINKHVYSPNLEAMKLMRAVSFKFKGLGLVPGVELWDSFDYMAEMYVVGLHRDDQGGISSIKEGGKRIACSVVVSSTYPDNIDRGDEIVYCGQGGRKKTGYGDGKQMQDQKLKGGNLALLNSYKFQTPIRVIRGHAKGRTKQEVLGLCEDKSTRKKYSFDGLYTVSDWKFEEGCRNYKVFKFTLKRQPGQPALDLTSLV